MSPILLSRDLIHIVVINYANVYTVSDLYHKFNLGRPLTSNIRRSDLRSKVCDFEFAHFNQPLSQVLL